jgi:hypothetical protein
MALRDIKQGVAEGNTALRNAGIRRAMGTMLVNGGLATMLSSLMQGDEKDKDSRSVMPHYHKHGSYVGGDLDEEGRLSYTSLDRYSPAPITAGFLANGLRGDWEGMAYSIFEPMISRGIGVDELVTITSKLVKASHMPLDVQDDKELWRALDELGWMAWPSKTLADIIRVADGRTKEQKEGTFDASEYAGKMVGVTASKVNLTHGTSSVLSRATSDYKNSYDFMRNGIRDYVVTQEEVTQEGLEEVMREALAEDKAAFEKYASKVQATGRLSYKTKKEILAAMDEWELDPRNSVKEALFTGKYTPPDIVEDLYASIVKTGLSKAAGKELRERLKSEKYTNRLEKMLRQAYTNVSKEMR